MVKEKRGKKEPLEQRVGRIHCHHMVKLNHHTERFECIEDQSNTNEVKLSSTVGKNTSNGEINYKTILNCDYHGSRELRNGVNLSEIMDNYQLSTRYSSMGKEKCPESYQSKHFQQRWQVCEQVIEARKGPKKSKQDDKGNGDINEKFQFFDLERQVEQVILHMNQEDNHNQEITF